MALFADSASLEELAALCAEFPVYGITTNPSIILKAVEAGQRLDDVTLARRLLDLCPGPVFMQPTATPSTDLHSEALRYAEVDSARIVLKLPMTRDGLAVSQALRQDGVRYAFTAVYSLAQAYCGIAAGAEWIIPYVGRMRRAGVDCCQRVIQMAQLLAQQGTNTRLLAASLKTASDVIEVTLAGANDITAQPEVIRTLIEDELTITALDQFERDWARVQHMLNG